MGKNTEKVEEVVEVVDSPAKASYRALLDVYAKQNPVKWEAKKEALLAKLETL